MTEDESKKDELIALDEVDPGFKFEVAAEPGGENIKKCFACGTCSSTCPVFAVNDTYNPRRIIRMVLLGLKEEVLTSDFIWLCSGCYSCHELCPRDVKITDLMGALRNIAVKEGHIPPAHLESINLLEKFGRLTEVSEFENTTREKKGMPVLKETIPEVKEVLKKAGIKDAVKGGE